MNKLIFVIGAGGHAKVLIDCLHAGGLSIKYVLEKNTSLFGSKILNEEVVSDTILQNFDPENVLLVNGVGSVNRSSLRVAIYNAYKKKGYTFLSVIHPTAHIGEDVTWGEGCQIMAGSIIQSSTKLGVNVIVNTKTSIDHDCVIADHVHLAPGVTLCGSVVIGNETHIGTGATVIQNITIGDHSLLAAGAVLLKSIGSDVNMAGVPAREFIS
jgi:sugar O-acyltransferase (sialic acid O-acetyltransferase NeuD family)